MSYQETIDYLYGLQHHGIKLGLDNSILLMELMGSPHRAFRSVHIAGTNGKGSTAAFLESILRHSGLRVGLYTSPHLVSFTERIRVNNVPISEEDVVGLAGRIRTACRQNVSRGASPPPNPTFFEVTTAMAFTYFAEHGVDIAVVEVGMGGRLDSTNVLTPLISIITNIDFEHTEFLGTTLEQIAGEKSGIIKEGIPVITGAAQPEVVPVLERTARESHAPFYRLGADFTAENISGESAQVFDYRGIRDFYGSLGVGMRGRYQVDNACLAVAATECLQDYDIRIDETGISRGLKFTNWEGRLECVSERPAIFLDGAHNPGSARMLSQAMQAMRASYRKLILVIGILSDKDYRGMISAFTSLADHIVVTRPGYSRAMDLDALAAETRKLHDSVDTADTVRAAITAARELASEDDCILITGSLYVVGDARAVLVPDAGSTEALRGLTG